MTYPETVCGCEYDGIGEDGCIEWRTANCDEHRTAAIPQPVERPFEQVLSPDELED